MPSITHEGPLDLVRQHPEIALEFARTAAGIAAATATPGLT
jgi:hypothetical protein